MCSAKNSRLTSFETSAAMGAVFNSTNPDFLQSHAAPKRIILYWIIPNHCKKATDAHLKVSLLEIIISFLQSTQEPKDRIVLGFLCTWAYRRMFQLLMNHLLNELSQIFLLLLAEKGAADRLRPVTPWNGSKDVPCVPLHRIVKVQAEVHPSEISHSRHAPTSGHKAVQSPWRSTSRHPAGKADTGRKRAGRGF